MLDGIFINYRRDDSHATAGRLRDRLDGDHRCGNVFMDVDNIRAGADFVEYLNSQVAACSLMLAVIGPHWLDAKDEKGQRRLDNPADYVRVEIAAALARKIRVVPVLVDGARVPKADELPDDLKPLVRRNAFELRNDQFRRDANALADSILAAPAPDRAERLWRIAQIGGPAVLVVVAVVWFVLHQLGVAVPWPGPPSLATLAAHELMLVNAKTGKCLTIAGGVVYDNNTDTAQVDCDGDPSRRWWLEQTSGAGIYKIKNVGTGRCLTIAGGLSPANNVRALQYECDDDPSRTWRVSDAGSGHYEIKNVQTHKCLTAPFGGGDKTNTPPFQYDCDPDLVGRWTLKPKE